MPGCFFIFSRQQTRENCCYRSNHHLSVGILAIVASAVSASNPRQFYRRDDSGGFFYRVGFSVLFCGEWDWMGVAALDKKQKDTQLRALLASFHILALSFTARRIISLDIA